MFAQPRLRRTIRSGASASAAISSPLSWVFARWSARMSFRNSFAGLGGISNCLRNMDGNRGGTPLMRVSKYKDQRKSPAEAGALRLHAREIDQYLATTGPPK
jgi:hypothetical protein